MNGHPGSGWRMAQPSRREVLKGIAGMGVAAGGIALLSGYNGLNPFTSRVTPHASSAARLETTTLRMAKTAALCFAPQYLAEDFMRAKGFSDVQFVDRASADILPAIGRGEIDMALSTVGLPIIQLDNDDSVVILAGVHVGCFELFANPAVHAISDLRGKQVAVTALGSGRHVHLAAMAAYVGIDPNRDFTWVTDDPTEAIRRLAAGEIDAIMANPPEPQELRARGIGHVIVNTNVDRPWAHYYCCMLIANRTFVQQHPVATRLGMRSILEAADLCASDPSLAARSVVDRGFANDFGYALQAFKDVSYDRWRDYDPEDSVRFYALRLREIGMIKSSPERIISRGTDWRIFNELKQELKG